MEMYASGVSLRAGLLQVREKMNCAHDTLPDNVILHQNAFASKSLLIRMAV